MRIRLLKKLSRFLVVGDLVVRRWSYDVCKASGMCRGELSGDGYGLGLHELFDIEQLCEISGILLFGPS